jgi:NAD(P)-dependent dehydrogenase (short-subunit alcohol dehydrogenase family)
MSVPIRTVAVAGASGNLGPAILNQLLAAGFTVTALTRADSQSTFPSTVKVVPVDYDSLDSLTAALKGQDALVSTLATLAIDAQIRLVDAAIAAGVRRFIPSEFGSNGPLARRLPVFASKVKVLDYLVQKVQERGNEAFSYTAVYNSIFFDWGLKVGFLLGKERYDGGERKFSTTRLETIGKAVAGVLKHAEETKNRDVLVHEAVVTQNQLAALSGKKWEAEDVKTDVLEKEAYAELAKEQPDFASAMLGFIKRAIWGEGYGGEFTKVDNELLGISMMSEKEIEELVKEYIH